jgi:sulfate adenylyltransferase subunit 1
MMNQLIKFTTAGSVDDGKSTLIGRLLFDSKSIFEDQLEGLRNLSKKRGGDLDFSLLTDGLRSEREQGITIDVAYRYFATPKRKFIIADTPGHIQYTRNMVTGASTADIALILVDARKGLVEQTFRHSCIASLLNIQCLVICVNKMDLVRYDECAYNKIVEAYLEFSSRLGISHIQFVPISALHGDNVVDRSPNTQWFKGSTLLHFLETVRVDDAQELEAARIPIQCVVRSLSKGHRDFRGYAGRIAGGVFKAGDDIIVLPSEIRSKIKEIWVGPEKVTEAFSPMSVLLTLEEEIDISRGDMIVKPNNCPRIEQEVEMMICWMNRSDLAPQSKFLIRHTSRELQGILLEIHYKLDINTLQRETVNVLHMNDIGHVKIRTCYPLLVDSYRKNRVTGSIILIDEKSNETVAAGMII